MSEARITLLVAPKLCLKCGIMAWKEHFYSSKWVDPVLECACKTCGWIFNLHPIDHPERVKEHAEQMEKGKFCEMCGRNKHGFRKEPVSSRTCHVQ